MNALHRTFLIIAVPAFVFCSCTSSGSKSTDTAPAAAMGVGTPQARVIFVDPGLTEMVYIEGVNLSRKTNKLLVAEANIQNPQSAPRSIEAQTLYYDAAGHLLYFASDAEAPWTIIALPPTQTYPYRSQSLTPSADHFVIRLRQVPAK